MASLLVLDTSIVMAWCFQDEADAYADSVLNALETHEAMVPGVWPLEVGNVLCVAERKQRLGQADSVRFIALLQALPIRVEPDTAEHIFKEVLSLAREQGLSTYDAAYLDLAMRLGAPLATRDAALLRAATSCGVEIFGRGQR